MPDQNADFLAILDVLSTHKVRFIVVGGVCAVLHGAPVTTFDVDIVYCMDEDNLQSVERALLSIDAYYRGRGNQRLLPQETQLKGGGHHLFNSRLGPVDLLSFIGNNHTYDDLVNRSETFRLEDMELLVLSLAALIEIKSETMRDKDEVHLRILKQVQKERDDQSMI